MALILAAQCALTLWGAARNSVTFDENFHVPDGVMIAARGDFRASPFNPPLIKAACGAAALAAGARLPDRDSVRTGSEFAVGESFMRRNADRYHRVFFAARCVVVLLGLLLGLLVWSFARRLYGAYGALLALGLYSFSAETLAHGGIAGTDLPTALGILATVYAFYGFARSGRWGWWGLAALSLGVALLTRFTSLILFPLLLALTAGAQLAGRLARPRRVWIGLGLLVVTAPLLLNAGYLFQIGTLPLGTLPLRSDGLRLLQRLAPWLWLPLPAAWLAGFDWQSFVSRQAPQPVFLFGRITQHPIVYYFPLALLLKWPLAFLGAIALRLARGRRGARLVRLEGFVTLPAVVLLLGPMFLVPLDIGVRYVYPMLAFVCVWLGGLWPKRDPAPRAPASARLRRARRWPAIALALVVLSAGEVLRGAPWYLSFFNLAAGGPGGGYRLINDSNVDWGQGLIALRDDMRRLGIPRVHLAYHGTTDPAIYGIDYIPFSGGVLGPQSDWLAVSDYYLVGLPQRMMTTRGRTPFVQFNFQGLPMELVAARPAGCMQLIQLPRDRFGRTGP